MTPPAICECDRCGVEYECDEGMDLEHHSSNPLNPPVYETICPACTSWKEEDDTRRFMQRITRH